jgi:hypothetical protein
VVRLLATIYFIFILWESITRKRIPVIINKNRWSIEWNKSTPTKEHCFSENPKVFFK